MVLSLQVHLFSVQMFSLGLVIFYENICKCCLEFVGASIVLGTTASCIDVLFISEGTIFFRAFVAF
jgi:hypothetical protein